MSTRHLMLLSVLLVGCPNEDRFEPMAILDASVDAVTQEQPDAEAIDSIDAQTPDDADMGIPFDGTMPDSMVDVLDSDLVTDSTISDMDTMPTACTVRFTVILPEDTNASDDIFIAGTFCQNECNGMADACCNWIPNDPQWSEIVVPRIDNTAVFEIELPPDVDYEYKYTLGDWSQEELREDCQPIANRLVRPECPNGVTYEVQDVIDAWKGRCN